MGSIKSKCMTQWFTREFWHVPAWLRTNCMAVELLAMLLAAVSGNQCPLREP